MGEPRTDLRIHLIGVLTLAALGGLAAQLWNVTVRKHQYYSSQILNSSQVTVRIPSVRGEIKDRNGLTLVRNRASYEVDFLLPAIVQSYRKSFGALPTTQTVRPNLRGMAEEKVETDIVTVVNASIVPKLSKMDLSEPYSSSKLVAHYKTKPVVPFTYREDIDFKTLAIFAERDLGLPGIKVGQKPVREYVYGALAAQILGYVGEPRDVNELPDISDYTYYEADVEGKVNLELTLDDYLKGKPGARVLKKNVKGQIEGEIREDPPERGSDVYLSIDARIQYIAEEAMRSVGRGAAVVVDPNNGEILAMVSVPSYDPNTFIPSISVKDWNALKNADADPLTNRAISAYAPGSTYKIPIALAGLKAGEGNDKFYCSGGVTYGNTYMKCWIADKGGSHGSQDLSTALKNSCNAYFYQYGNATGIDQIDAVGVALGLGQKTGVELSYENGGILPGKDWLAQNYPRERWSNGYTANTSIGQGFVLASPLQMAMIAATVANGGVSYYPTLVHKIVHPDGTEIRKPGRIRTDLRNEGLTEEQIEKVRKGMWRVVNEEGGTAKAARVPGTVVAGKTGTAQFFRDGKKDNHTWFISFAPYDKPTLAVCVFIQGAKSGGGTAAPIAAKIIKDTMALQTGYDPGLKPLKPAVGSFAFIESINFERDVPAAAAAASDEETAEHTSGASDQRVASRGKSKRSDNDAPDIKQEADSRPQKVRKAEPVATPRKRSFWDFFRGKPKPTPAPANSRNTRS
ncbi:MAG TPA: penicillin-binding protein 2 [Chthoniobacterales bacterium]